MREDGECPVPLVVGKEDGHFSHEDARSRESGRSLVVGAGVGKGQWEDVHDVVIGHCWRCFVERYPDLVLPKGDPLLLACGALVKGLARQMQQEEQRFLVHTHDDMLGRGEVSCALVVVAGDGFGEGTGGGDRLAVVCAGIM